jgi:CBS domain-containing protein
MTSNVITVPPESSLAEIAKILEDNRIKRVPVVRGGKLEGIIKRGNLLQALATADVSQPASIDDRTIRSGG